MEALERESHENCTRLLSTGPVVETQHSLNRNYIIYKESRENSCGDTVVMAGLTSYGAPRQKFVVGPQLTPTVHSSTLERR